ncbi:Wall-associated receptor kinase-like 5 [Camellia lanceoleosa]|uniref:Wall-associated receptor kinase-like 5 n=1 Tax=Camellia lanceoleosa TaxID=1840588 RepID=A0ACC0HE83_9ERIC|nr:Wall-associated receptor kinase-like 5 [Camellia lanceoleosa]
MELRDRVLAIVTLMNGIECKNPSSISSNGVAPYLIKIGLEVLEISLDRSYLQVNNPVTSPNYAINNNNNVNSSPSNSSVDLRSSPFRFSETNNVFMAVDFNCSSNQMATFNNLAGKTITQCSSSCDPTNNSNNISFRNVRISRNMQYLQGYKVNLGGITDSTIQSGVQSCLYAFLVDNQTQVSMGMNTSFSEAVPTHIPAVLEWVYNTTDLGLVPDKSYSCLPSSLAYSSLSDDKCVVVQTLHCVCNFLFSGDPYFSNGCLDTSIKPPKPNVGVIIGKLVFIPKCLET